MKRSPSRRRCDRPSAIAPIFRPIPGLVALTGMTTVTVSAATQGDIGSLVTSVAELFGEDGGRHDPLRDLGWPAREGAAYYSSLVDDGACLLALARDSGNVIGHLIGKLHRPGGTLSGCIAELESRCSAPSRSFLLGARANRCGSVTVPTYRRASPEALVVFLSAPSPG